MGPSALGFLARGWRGFQSRTWVLELHSAQDCFRRGMPEIAPSESYDRQTHTAAMCWTSFRYGVQNRQSPCFES